MRSYRGKKFVPIVAFISLILIGILWNGVGCIIDDIPLTGHACYKGKDDAPCLKGWHCDKKTNQCVKDTAQYEQISESIPSETPTIKEEKYAQEVIVREEQITSQDTFDGGQPEEPAMQEQPVQDLPSLSCPYRIAANDKKCPRKFESSCNFIIGPSETNAVELPTPLSGAAIVVKGRNDSILHDDREKIFVYLIGGGDGTAGAETYYTEVKKDGSLTAWKKGAPLKNARRNARAFLIGDYVYVVGGVDASGQPVAAIEYAEIKQDGTMKDFQVAGSWPNARAKAGIAYMYGYFYFVGGLENGTTPSFKVQRALLNADHQIVRWEDLPPLPEKRAAPLVTTHFFLYLIGTKDNQSTLMAKVLPNGDLEGWCKTTAIPKSRTASKIVSAEALSDVRRLFLFGLKKEDKSIDPVIYMSQLQPGRENNPPGGGLMDWLCSDYGDPKTSALLQTPRLHASVVVIRKYLFFFGGADQNGKALKSIERVVLVYRKEQQCDLDADTTADTKDYCPYVYAPANKNSDQPSDIQFPEDVNHGWVARFGLGDACEYKKMSLVPAGKFTRGTADATQHPDAPAKEVRMDGFYIDYEEVTNQDYKECVKQQACPPPTSKASATVSDYYDNDKYKNYPVVNVTWKMAQAYCKFRGKRLPTEAEWEKAARALTSNLFPWGNSTPSCEAGKEHANYSSCGAKDTKPVRSYPAGRSPYGLFDMAGNVREWTYDYYSDKYYNSDSSLVTPSGPGTGSERVIRGGSYKSSLKDLRVFARDHAKPDSSANDLGFRCARSLFLPLKTPN